MSSWTNCKETVQLVPYDSVSEAAERLRSAERSGMALFVLNDEPAGYYEAAFQLRGWRVKRLSERSLMDHYAYRTDGVWDKRRRSYNIPLGQSRWKAFIDLNALDVVQLLDVVPFRPEQAGAYEAQLIIDVGRDRRHYALSLLLVRCLNKRPDFAFITHVLAKPDQQHESINPVLLADQVIELFGDALPRHCDPLASLVVLRDGRLCGQEIDGIDQAIKRLTERSVLLPDCRIDLAELHKDTLKSLRIWEVDDNNAPVNPLEGHVVRLTDKMVLVVATGATLEQGTSEPFLIVGNGRCSSLEDVAAATFTTAQMNWSSPKVAQRLPLLLKHADAELQARATQEIRRLR